MKYKTLLKKLQKLSKEELEQEILLFFGDGGSYSKVLSVEKTEKDNEVLGCEEVGDAPCGYPKGQVYLVHSC